MRGLLGGDPVAWARTHGAELVDFGADRAGTATLRDHVRATLAMEQGAAGIGAMADQLLRRARLGHLAGTRVDRLSAPARVVLALVEAAAGAAFAPRAHAVVVPEPPIPWPARHEVRLAAMQLLRGDLVLHATDLSELLPLVPPDAIETTDGVRATAADPRGVLVVRVFAVGAPYEAFCAALRARGVRIEGGPVAHRLEGPVGFSARDVLAVAHETDVDVLEVRPAFPTEAAPVVDTQVASPAAAPTPEAPAGPAAGVFEAPREEAFRAYDGTDPFAEVEARERADKGDGPGGAL